MKRSTEEEAQDREGSGWRSGQRTVCELEKAQFEIVDLPIKNGWFSSSLCYVFLNVYQRVCRKDDEPWDFGGNRGKLWDRPNCIQTNGLCENETPVERWFDDILWMVELKSAMIRSHASHPLKSNFPFMVDRLSGGQADRWDYSWDWSGGGSWDVLFLEWEPGLGIVFICSCRGCCSSIIPHTDIMLMIHSSLHFLDPDVFSSSLSLSLTLTIYI